ncbi:hypothetical protein [Actinosynnema sp. ALI-1.44]|uniref:hypothetical protein n=1 Tax=Actinosynnema sp. ALI-1.44 TaxID=1933779 RepID=UPI0011776638|nr:hypothetical protein [Actinosynnema sp. ALI-1.44]
MTAPVEVVRSLRCQAARFAVLANTDHNNAAAAWEEALHLRCRAAVIEQLSELYGELGSELRALDAFTNSLRRLS